MERDGILVGPYESKDTMKVCEDWARGKVPSGFGKELFQPDLDRLSPHLEVGAKRIIHMLLQNPLANLHLIRFS